MLMETETLKRAGADYETVSAAIAYITRNHQAQPSLDDIADHVGLSPHHLQRLFTRWAGLSPKAFLQAVTLDHARALLRSSTSVLDTAFEVGLSGPGRLHDLFVTHEGMTPGAYKSGGAGLCVTYGFHDSPFGRALAMMVGDSLIGLAFADRGGEGAALDDMRSRWPNAAYIHDPAAGRSVVATVFDPRRWGRDRPVRITMIGTDFQLRVWQTLLTIPPGAAATYSDIAAAIARPDAARAVGAAVGRNPISFVVPCHRVLGKSGRLTGYHWGLTRKRAMLGWEAGLAG